MHRDKAAHFPGNTRIHVGLSVQNLERSKDFYQVLFGAKPSKERPGYVKFEPESPSVNLTLNQVTRVFHKAGPAAHYGIQVKSSQAVWESKIRLERAGLETFVEEGTTCCYAVQNKIWVTDPDGNRWEVFVVLDGDSEERIDSASYCCAMEPGRPSRAAACC